ncbi:MAG: succinylglutamate desuccinylase/aspartoacylase family protein [Acidobacteriota bacterium]
MSGTGPLGGGRSGPHTTLTPHHRQPPAATHSTPARAAPLTGPAVSRSSFDRLIGAHGDDAAGPLLICVAAIHGNERAGIIAARRVLEALSARRPPFRGRFVAFLGNRTAAEKGRRFQDFDLNRAWLPDRIASLLARDPDADRFVEDAEQRALLAHLADEMNHRESPAFFVDLHTSSADGAPFVTVGDTLRNRLFARRLGLPMVLGLEEQIDGALLEYLNNHGHVTAGVEGGRHDDPRSVDHHEAVLWLALLAAGHLSPSDVPQATACERVLAAATPGIPRLVEVRHRHSVGPGDHFVMQPGYRNFDAVPAGRVLAVDVRGEIRAREACRLLLPLYQNQGDDGFFTVRQIRPIWLRLSWLLRRIGVPAWVESTPGVRSDPEEPRTLRVNTRIARLVPLQVFHLLGYRKRRWDDHVLRVSRRDHDVLPGRPVNVRDLPKSRAGR